MDESTMVSKIEQLVGLTLVNVIETLKTSCFNRNLLALCSIDNFLRELWAKGMDDVAAYLSDDPPFDWELYEL